MNITIIGSYLYTTSNKNIDTGMGLERMTSISQNVRTNYETDLFMPIIEEVEHISGKNILKITNKM